MKRVRLILAVGALALFLTGCATPVDKAERLYEQYIEAKNEGDYKRAEKLWNEYQGVCNELSKEEQKELNERLWKVLK